MYNTTLDFIKKMSASSVRYTVLRDSADNSDSECIGEEKSDAIQVSFKGENVPTIKVNFFFSPDETDVAVRIFDIFSYQIEKIINVALLCQKNNAEYRWFKFCMNESDNTVQAEADAEINEDTAGEICLSLLHRGVTIVDKTYPEFMKGMWA